MNSLNEMGMRKPTASFNVRHINKCLGIIQAEMVTNFEKEGIKDTFRYEELGTNEACVITFIKPLRDETGKNYMDKAESYLRGAKLNLASIQADPEILSSIASIANCIDYDNATFISDHEVELINPEVTSYDVQLIVPKPIGRPSKPKIAEEKVYYGIFSDSGYGPRSSTIIPKIKKGILQDCFKCITNPDHNIYRDNGGIYGIFSNREEVATAIRSKRDDEAYSSQYSRGYYRTAYIVYKCNKNGELIMSLRDFYDPSLWDKYPSEDEIRECIKAYNASILNKGVNE